MVAPYNFGGAHGFSVFSPDQWAFKHWQAYLDYLRLFNMNVVGLYPMRLYDPAIPETWPNKTRYEIWEQTLEYAHRLGMKFTWVQTANHVHQETWWRHPELRLEHEHGWFGFALCYSKGRDVIRQTQRHTFERFKKRRLLHAHVQRRRRRLLLRRMFADQADVFLRMVTDTQDTLREVGSQADVIFWNWRSTGGIRSSPKRFPDTRSNSGKSVAYSRTSLSGSRTTWRSRTLPPYHLSLADINKTLWYWPTSRGSAK